MAAQITSRMFVATRGGQLHPWRLRHGTVVDPDSAAALDEGLAVWMPGPRSYTGEDVCELHCHGSPTVVSLVLEAAVRAGARPAEPGEFTRRAVLNGRMDLLQAEAVADLINARVQAGVEAAWQQLQGALSEELEEIRALVLRVLADVEANIDFSDDELPSENPAARCETVEQARHRIARLLSGFAAARRQREGFLTVVIGRPNVGKSSLINRLLGYGRMIVSDEPGTTRDSVEEVVDLGKVAFVLTDTAGLRQTASKAEQAAVDRARDKVASADLLVTVIDGSAALTSDDERILELSAPRPGLLVVNKLDLPSRLDDAARARLARLGQPLVDVSARDGTGCGRLMEALASLADTRMTDDAQPASISRVRHRAALERADHFLADAVELVTEGGAAELAAVELRSALTELATISQAVDNDDILDLIFREFCIGK